MFNCTATRFSTALGRGLITIGLAGALGLTATARADELPRSMTWTAYDVGSTGYAEASAIADAFGRAFGTRVRIQPSGSAIGRLQPVLMGRADYGFLATETWFATEGIEDFDARRWGPQDLRVVAGRPSAFALATAADAGIETLEDLRGKRLAYVAGNPSVNVKCDAFLAFAGLSRDDVRIEMFPSFGAALGSLAAGRADAGCTTTTASLMYELKESPRGLRWMEVPPDNEQGWERIRELAPFFQPLHETIGAGLSEDEPAWVLGYRYPLIVARADRPADEVYAFVKALDEAFGLYQDSLAGMDRWALDQAGTPPTDAPFHEGAIRYFKELGVWTDEHQAWNDRREQRLNALLESWDDALSDADGKRDDDFPPIWQTHRSRALGTR